MRAIFISYRRDDAEGQAGRLFDDLAHHFGEDAVFMDVAAIEPGRDFRRAIDQQVASCGVLLAIIGKDWVSAQDESGARRLDDPMDFVRLETASALKRDIPVVPVLVQGARMPRAQDLPEDLKELAFRNAVELTHARWDSDLQVLVKALRAHVQGDEGPPISPPRSAPRQPGSAAGVSLRTLIAGLLGVLVLVGGWYVRSRLTRTSLVGSWSGGGTCTLVFTKDDGKSIVGGCDSGMRHDVAGVYVTKKRIAITITRIDENWQAESGKPQRCETSVEGNIAILRDDLIEVSQDGWGGECGAKSDRVTTRLNRF